MAVVALVVSPELLPELPEPLSEFPEPLSELLPKLVALSLPDSEASLSPAVGLQAARKTPPKKTLVNALIVDTYSRSAQQNQAIARISLCSFAAPSCCWENHSPAALAQIDAFGQSKRETPARMMRELTG